MEQEFQTGQLGWLFPVAAALLPSLTLGFIMNAPTLPGTGPQQLFAGIKVYSIRSLVNLEQWKTVVVEFPQDTEFLIFNAGVQIFIRTPKTLPVVSFFL